MIEKFADMLRSCMDEGLPGAQAQVRMAPASRIIQNFQPEQYPLANKGSVLLLLYPYKKTLYTVLIKRPDYAGVHSGQVSLPGGRHEKFDIDAEETALREAEEEVGVNKNDVIIIGKLSDLYIPPSNFFVYTFVGYCKQRPSFIADEIEVERLIEIPLSMLLNDSLKGVIDIERNGKQMQAPCYVIDGYKVWGATAIILHEFELLIAGEEQLKKMVSM